MSPKLLNIFLVALPVVIYLGYLEPAYTGKEGLVWGPEVGIEELQVQDVQYTNTLKQIDIIKGAAETLNKDYKSVDKEMLEKAAVMLPDTIDLLKLRNEVTQIAANNGVAINDLKVEKGKKETGGFNYQTVSFSMRARYSTFKAFMEVLEKNKRFFVLDKANINRPTSDSSSKDSLLEDGDILNFTLTFRVHYLQ